MRSCIQKSKLGGFEPVAQRLWFVVSDMAYIVYSQVTDALTIHQVSQSSQLQYAYALLGTILLQNLFMFFCVVKVNLDLSVDAFGCKTWAQKGFCNSTRPCGITLVCDIRGCTWTPWPKYSLACVVRLAAN